ncbi:MAG: GNAT family N-acetyltransferase [Acidimicrobiales bacterium]
MTPLSFDDLDAASCAIESAVDHTPEIDRWCSGPDWVLPVAAGFAPDTDRWCRRVETPSGSGFALLARYSLEDGRSIVAGLEPLWGFASPLLGAEVEAVCEAVAAELDADPSWDLLVVTGMPRPSGPEAFTSRVVRSLGRLGQVRVGAGIVRQVADIGGGYDAWAAGRSPRFRRSLRQAADRADRAGLRLVDRSDDGDVFDRLLDIERRSWKGLDESGIAAPQMRETYRRMVERLQRRGRARIHVAVLDGRDVGYIMGGVRAGNYRGLQLSYAEEAAGLSIGHLLQHHQLQRLTADREATRYDLGMDLDYKRRWADRAEPSFTLVFDRRRPTTGSGPRGFPPRTAH